MKEPRTKVEEAFVGAVEQQLREDPTRVLPLLAETLENQGIRVVAVAIGTERRPQVAATLSVDDVSAETTRLAVIPLLRRLGIGEDAVQIMSVAAGGAVAKWAAQYRAQRNARRAAESARQTASPFGNVQTPADGDFDGPPRWTPGPKRD